MNVGGGPWFCVAWLVTTSHPEFHMAFCKQDGINNIVSDPQIQKVLKTGLVDVHSSEKLARLHKEKRANCTYNTPSTTYVSSKWPLKRMFLNVSAF